MKSCLILVVLNLFTQKLVYIFDYVFTNTILDQRKSVAAKIEVDSIKSDSPVVFLQRRSDDLVVTGLQFPDFPFRSTNYHRSSSDSD